MMLEELVYGYSQKVNSSRQVAKRLWENVNFMWMDKRIGKKGKKACPGIPILASTTPGEEPTDNFPGFAPLDPQTADPLDRGIHLPFDKEEGLPVAFHQP